MPFLKFKGKARENREVNRLDGHRIYTGRIGRVDHH